MDVTHLQFFNLDLTFALFLSSTKTSTKKKSPLVKRTL